MSSGEKCILPHESRQMDAPAATVKDLGMAGRKLENRTLQPDTLIFPVQTTLAWLPCDRG